MYDKCTCGTQWLWQEYGCYWASDSWDLARTMRICSSTAMAQAPMLLRVFSASAQVGLLQRFYDPLGLGPF